MTHFENRALLFFIVIWTTRFVTTWVWHRLADQLIEATTTQPNHASHFGNGHGGFDWFVHGIPYECCTSSADLFTNSYPLAVITRRLWSSFETSSARIR